MKPRAQLTPEEAARAIYLDFEGCKDQAPSVLGVLYAEGKASSPDRLVLRQDIIERGLWSAAGQIEVDGAYRYDSEPTTLARSIADVLARAHRQDRVIVSWSEHDLSVVLEHVENPRQRRRFEAHYRNARLIARRWANRCLGGAPESGTLATYLDLVGYRRPVEASDGHAADAIRRARRGIEAHGSWDAMRESQQQAWQNLLTHNLHDCYGMRRVCLRAAFGLAGEEGHRSSASPS